MNDPVDFAHAANEEVLVAFEARHGKQAGDILRAAWSVAEAFAGITIITDGKLDVDEAQAMQDAMVAPLVRVMRLMPDKSMAKEVGSMLDVMSDRFLKMMRDDDAG